MKKVVIFNFIKDKLGKDFSLMDAEQAFVHPAPEVTKLLDFVERKYEKHLNEVESIISHITADDLVDIIMSENQRCQSLKRFCEDLILY